VSFLESPNPAGKNFASTAFRLIADGGFAFNGQKPRKNKGKLGYDTPVNRDFCCFSGYILNEDNIVPRTSPGGHK